MPHPSSDRTPTGVDEADLAVTAVRRVEQLTAVTTPIDHDETLSAQLDARDRSSAEDARTQAERRRAAAAKALARLRGDGDVDRHAPPQHTEPPTAEAPTTETPTMEPPATEPPESQPAETGPPETGPVETRPPAAPSPGAVPVPTGGPAAVVAQVFGAAATGHGTSTPPLLELRPSTIGAGVDQLGDRVLVYDDRVEHRDRHGRLRRTLARRDVTDISIQRRLTGTVLELHSRTGLPLVLKGVRPDAADEARRLLTGDGPPSPAESRPAFDEGALLHKLVDLHRAGVLDEHELAAKTEVVARLAREHRLASP